MRARHRRPHVELQAVTPEDVAEVVSRATGIPARLLSEEERHRLANWSSACPSGWSARMRAVRVVALAAGVPDERAIVLD